MTMEGYLFKRSDHLKRWNKRYFKLESSTLTYYEDASSLGKERGSWRIDGTCDVSNYHEKENAFSISISGSSMKPIILAADDDFSLKKWIDALASATGKGESGAAGAGGEGGGSEGGRRGRLKYKKSYATKSGPSYLFGQQDQYKESGDGLRDAIKHGNFEFCRKILQTKKNLATFIDNSDNSVLHLAVLFNDKRIAELLVECGADINLPNKRKETPLSLAKPMMKKYLQQWAEAKAAAAGKDEEE